ncbi:MAG: PIN domain-containing protein [Chloroflexi bacterium]|nr:PIN domain-containing protein [Chloroflexota bacterium]
MAALCDVNCLLAICYDRHIHHPAALAWLEQQAALSVGICRNTQLGLLRLLTNASVMIEDVCNLKQSWKVYDTLMSDERFVFYAEPIDLEQHFRRYTASGSVSPKLWQDAYLAAFACATKLHLVTFDEGFQQFKGLGLALLGS